MAGHGALPSSLRVTADRKNFSATCIPIVDGGHPDLDEGYASRYGGCSIFTCFAFWFSGNFRSTRFRPSNHSGSKTVTLLSKL